MAVQVSYPGVYIDEFAPGAPIQGVGTSTAGFVGTALSGPSGRPYSSKSWDFFEATFGGFIDETGHYLCQGRVKASSANGGTRCYVVRSSTGVTADVDLPSRGPLEPATDPGGAGPARGDSGNAAGRSR